MRTRLLTTAFVLLITWCLPSCRSTPAVKTAEPTPTNIAPTIAAATFTATSAPTTTPGPVGQNFQFYASTPLLPLGAAGTWDSDVMGPGSVVFYQNKFHMFYNGGTYTTNTGSVGYAVSPDGLTFSRVSNEPVFTREDVPWQVKPGDVGADCVMVEDGTWILYFTALKSPGSAARVVGRATAASPSGPWAVDPKPVLEPGEGKAWDAVGVSSVEVVRFDGGYVMYYTGALGIGMATSADGIHWEKYNDPATVLPVFTASDPVIGRPGAEDPNVQKTPWGWIMVYRYKRSLYYAESADGLHWKDAPVNPIVTLFARDVWYSSLLVKDQTAFLYFEANHTDSTYKGTSVYAATWTLIGPE